MFKRKPIDIPDRSAELLKPMSQNTEEKEQVQQLLFALGHSANLAIEKDKAITNHILSKLRISWKDDESCSSATI